MRRLVPLALALGACGGLPRGAHLRDAEGGLALFTALPGTYTPHPTSLVRLRDGGYGLAGISDGPLRLGPYTARGGFAARLDRDGSVRFVRSIVGAQSGDNLRQRPVALAGPEGSLLLAGVFRGGPSLPEGPPSVWPLRVQVLLSIEANGASHWLAPLERSEATDATGLVAAAHDSLGGALVLFSREHLRLERYSGHNGSLWTGVAFVEPEGAATAPLRRNPWYIAAAGRANGIDEDVLVAGELAPASTLRFDERPGAYATNAGPYETAAPSGRFLARIALYHRSVRWARALEFVPEGLAVEREGAVLWHQSTAHRFALHDGSLLWQRTFGCDARPERARLVRMAGDRVQGHLVAVLAQHDQGRCLYQGQAVDTRTAPPVQSALVAMRVDPRDGHTSAVAVLRAMPAGSSESDDAGVNCLDALVEPDGRAVLYGSFTGALEVDGFRAESAHGTENRCTHEDYVHRPDCARVPYEHGALYVARPTWRGVIDR